MKRWQKRLSPPPGHASYIKATIVVGDNELLIGKPIPPSVELTPVGPAINIVEGGNDSAQEDVNNLMRAALASSQDGGASLLYSQTAAILNTTEAAIQGLLHQGRTRLRRDNMTTDRPDSADTSGENATDKPANEPCNDTIGGKPDESVWDLLIRHSVMILECLARRYCHALDPHALQDCLNQAATSIATKSAEDPQFAARWVAVARKDLYLLKAADRLARREILRSKRLIIVDPQMLQPETADTRSIQEEVNNLMLAALATLPRQQRSAWIQYRRLACDQAGKSEGSLYTQIAKELNTTEVAVRGLLSRARTRLREYVQRRLSADC